MVDKLAAERDPTGDGPNDRWIQVAKRVTAVAGAIGAVAGAVTAIVHLFS